jgi:hypothetical protein
MQSVLLELHTAKVMDVGGVSFHLLKQELNLGLRNYLLLVNSDDARPLPKLPYPAAPTRPDAQPHTIDRERRRRNDVEHTNSVCIPLNSQRTSSQRTALCRSGRITSASIVKRSHHPARQKYQYSDTEHDPVESKRRKSPCAYPMHKPGDHCQCHEK